MRPIYLDWLTKPYSPVAHMLAETMGRIADRCEASDNERREMRLALDWCRANCNPHTPKEPTK